MTAPENIKAKIVALQQQIIDLESQFNPALLDYKAVEQAMRDEHQAIMTAITDTIILVDADGFIQYSNHPAQNAPLINGDVGENWLKLLGAQQRGQAAENIQNALNHHKSSTLELRTRNKENKIAWFEVTFNPLPDYKRREVVIILRDISLHKKADESLYASEARLRRSRDKLSLANASLEKAARIKDEFLASMSHELRTPLVGILGLSESLQMENFGPVSEKQHATLKIIEASGRHLLALINDILDISRIGAGMLELQISPNALIDVCRASLKLTAGLAHQKQQQVSFTFDPASIVLNTDASRLKKMLISLLSNAVKFTPNLGRLGLEVQGNAEKQQVSLSVWDTGIGIKSEDIQYIFDPFVQLDAGLSRTQSGIGLGLSLVQRMARLHGGSLQVESVQGQGSRFTILLPWEGQTNLVDPNSQLARLKLKSSLTIEYNPLDAEYLRDYLETLGIKNVIHALGEGAVEMASRLQPDVIFIDLFMPDGSGMEILEQLKGNPRTRDILVVITSIAEQHSQARAFGAGGYLLKPFTLEDLRQELDKATGYTTPSRQSPLNSSQVSLPLVLVVDDHEALLETIEDTLKRQQLEISIARSGNEMLEMVNEVLPGLILIDIHTPGMDGLEAIQRLRAHPDARVGSVPILAVSSLITPGDRERCLAAGATEYISKPFYLPELTEKVLVLLKK